jgi:uncharacterized protein
VTSTITRVFLQTPLKIFLGEHVKKISIMIGLLIGLSLIACQNTPRVSSGNTESILARYLIMRDGTRIAIDVYLPKREPGARVPTALKMTRYHRSEETQRSDPLNDRALITAERWNDNGYAVVNVDARGTGASFGFRSAELTQIEIDDYSEVLTWIAAQTWSNKRVGAQGISYDGITAELLASLEHPALKATAPWFTDYDLYKDLIFPGGVYNSTFGTKWFLINNFLDGINGADQLIKDTFGVSDDQLRAAFPPVNSVDGSDGNALRSQAILAHQSNANGSVYLPKIDFKDDQSSARFDQISFSRRASVEVSQVPFLILASWQDAATASGTFSRLSAFQNHQEVHIGSWSHGGFYNSDPFAATGTPADQGYSSDQQVKLLIAFFDRFVKGNEKPQSGLKRLSYYTQGEGIWHQSDGLPKSSAQRWYLNTNHALGLQTPTNAIGSDAYPVNFDLGMGNTSRWNTPFDGSAVTYPDQRELDAKRLVYTSAPLQTDLRLTGIPRISLELRSSTPDGAVFAYLEDVSPDGTVRVFDEGELRLTHRKIASLNPDGRALRTPRTYAKADAQAMPVGEVQNVTFDLIPTSTLLKKGHQLRVAMAGHDKDQFKRYAAEGQVYTIERNAVQISFLELPIETP